MRVETANRRALMPLAVHFCMADASPTFSSSETHCLGVCPISEDKQISGFAVFVLCLMLDPAGPRAVGFRMRMLR